ncbi:MAG TPA: CheR family methyltransferase [Polyangia bacterium]|jgi:chemotaxis protein methyltransferase CheR|nr:CheR family methyltransferase [Polyangia bacterium]
MSEPTSPDSPSSVDVWSSPAVAQLATLIAEEAGLVLPPQRRQELETALVRLAKEHKLGDGETCARRALTDAALREAVITEVTVGETYFFRDREQLEYLRDSVLPAIDRERGPDAELRLWSAGCASGEEAWTLAMLLDNAHYGERSHVFASDISPKAIARGKAGVYRAWSLRGAESAPARAYLRHNGTEFVVADALRKQVSFSILNLAGDGYPSLVNGLWGMDVIFCRNVLIYFDAETVAAVARRLHACLRDDGWLFTAPSDPPLHDFAPLYPLATSHGIVYRRQPPVERATPPARRLGPDATMVRPPRRLRPELPKSQPRATPRKLTAVRAAPPPTPPQPATDARDAAPREVRQLVQRGDLRAALTRVMRAIDSKPLVVELHLLRALIAGELGRGDEALTAVRCALYLDPTLAIAHFILASLLERRGDEPGARRSYRNALALVSPRPADEAIALGDGETAGSLAERTRHQLARLTRDGAPA